LLCHPALLGDSIAVVPLIDVESLEAGGSVGAVCIERGD
jgi:hypothetical protein